MTWLLDTQCWLWLQTSPKKISTSILAKLQDPNRALFLSAASTWEIAITYALGKLPLPESPEHYVPNRMMRNGVKALPVECHHTLQVANLPPHHKDPFDRLLVAQSQLEEMTLLTSDAVFAAYEIDMIRVDR